MIRRHIEIVTAFLVVLALFVRALAFAIPAPGPASAAFAAEWEICSHSQGGAGDHRPTGNGTADCHHCVLCQIVRPAAAMAPTPVWANFPSAVERVIFHNSAASLPPLTARLFTQGPRAPPAIVS